MSVKRSKGEGTVYEIEENKWIGKIHLGRKKDGSPNRISVYGKSKNEVLEKLRRLSIANGDGKYWEEGSVTFGEWAEIWIKTYKINLKPKTRETYENAITNHLIPAFDKLPVKKITTLQLQTFMGQKSEDGLSYETCKKLKSILKMIFDTALGGHLIEFNPALSITLPRRDHKRADFFTVEEQIKFFEVAKTDPLYELLVLAVDTGARLGELLPLEFSDIDFINAELNIDKTLIYVKDYKKSSKNKNILLVQNSVKTKMSERKVPLTSRCIDILRNLQLNSNGSKIIFHTRTGNYFNPRNIDRSFRRIAKNAELKECSFHILRHSFSTRQFELNVPVKIVSAILGHEKISTTLDIYTHVIPKHLKEATRKLDEHYEKLEQDRVESQNKNDHNEIRNSYKNIFQSKQSDNTGNQLGNRDNGNSNKHQTKLQNNKLVNEQAQKQTNYGHLRLVK